MLVADWLESNQRSERLQKKLGFQATAKFPNMWRGRASIAAVWMGGGEIKQKEHHLGPFEGPLEVWR